MNTRKNFNEKFFVSQKSEISVINEIKNKPWLAYGMIFVAVSFIFAVVVELTTISKLGKVFQSLPRTVMFYITLFLIFLIFFSSFAFLLGVSTNFVFDKLRR